MKDLAEKSKVVVNEHQEYFQKQFKCKEGPSKLPQNFYADILMLETSLFQSYTSQDLDAVLKLYMIGLEYYELKDNDKALGFQTRANWLLGKPEVMQILKKQEETKINEENENIDYETVNLIKTIKSRISLQKKFAKEKDRCVLEKKSEAIIKEITTFNDDKATVDNFLHQEFDKQKNSLMEKLKRKKANTLSNSLNDNIFTLSLNNTTNNNDIENKKNNNSTENNDNNIPQSPLYDITEINSNTSKSGDEDDNTSNDENHSNEGNDKTELNNKIVSNTSEADAYRSPERKTNHTSMFNKTSSTMDNIAALIHLHIPHGSLGSKQKEMLLLIKEKIDEYLYSYNEYFYDEHYKKVIKKIEQLFAEKYKKYIDISKTYQDQIKETQYDLLTVDTMNETQIELIILSLIEEKDHELSKLDDEYSELLKDHISSFKALGFKQSKPSVLYLQEKTKLEIYNCLLSLFSS